jgi:hypothetical protein
MAEAVDDALVVEDAVGGHEILDQRRIGRHRLRRMCRSHHEALPVIDTLRW